MEADLIEHRRLVVRRETQYIELDGKFNQLMEEYKAHRQGHDIKVQESDAMRTHLEQEITKLRTDREQLLTNQEANSARRHSAETERATL